MFENVKSALSGSVVPIVAAAIIGSVVTVTAALLVDSSVYVAAGVKEYCRLPQDERAMFRAAVTNSLGEGYSATIDCPGDQ